MVTFKSENHSHTLFNAANFKKLVANFFFERSQKADTLAEVWSVTGLNLGQSYESTKTRYYFKLVQVQRFLLVQRSNVSHMTAIWQTMFTTMFNKPQNQSDLNKSLQVGRFSLYCSACCVV